jgi:hypothetical protein
LTIEPDLMGPAAAPAVLAGYDVVIRGNDARHDKSLLQSAAVHVAG